MVMPTCRRVWWYRLADPARELVIFQTAIALDRCASATKLSVFETGLARLADRPRTGPMSHPRRRISHKALKCWIRADEMAG